MNVMSRALSTRLHAQMNVRYHIANVSMIDFLYLQYTGNLTAVAFKSILH
jgi:hypothetical protein